jgi:hypothetical protein
VPAIGAGLIRNCCRDFAGMARSYELTDDLLQQRN